MTIEKTELMLQFENETGKHAIWKDKITINFNKWVSKRKKQEKIITKTPSNINVILKKLQDFEERLIKLEIATFDSVKIDDTREITEDQFLRTTKIAYNSLEKKLGDFVSISVITNKIQDILPWSTKKIHDILYKLFMEYKVDLQPGKILKGTPLVKDGQTYVWFNLK